MSALPRWKKYLTHASRSRRFLWKLTVGCILGAVIIGCAIHHLRPSGPDKLAERVLASIPHDDPESTPTPSRDKPQSAMLDAFEQELANPALEFRHLVDALPQLAPLLSSEQEKVGNIFSRRFSNEEARLAADFIALYSSDSARQKAAAQRLHELAAGDPPPRFANHLLGQRDLLLRDHRAAFDHFAKEGLRPEAIDSRELAVHALIASKNFDELDHLTQTDSRYAKLVSPFDQLDIAIARKDWRGIFKWVPLTQLVRQDRGLLALTLITGAAWAFFLFHLGQVPVLFSPTTLLCLAGFALGALSTTPTLYAVVWQDDFLHFSMEGSSFKLLAYYVGGVGLREEVCKLLLFLPLLPFLLKRGNELEALLVASFVGLGFAIEENGGYFLGSHGIDAPGRFLTANFLHIVLTGLNGLALFRAFARGGRGINELLTVFPLTVLVHGLYDGLGDVPELMEIGGYLSITLYVLSSMLYFNRAHELRENVRMTFGLTGAFILGLSVVAAAVIIEQITSIGPVPGLMRIVPEFLGVGVLVLMFTRVFNEGLAE